MSSMGHCVICTQNLCAENTAVLKCGHTFHMECVSRWVNQSGTCPVCRQNTQAEDIIKLFYVPPNNENESLGLNEEIIQLKTDLDETKAKHTESLKEIQRLEKKLETVEIKLKEEEKKSQISEDKLKSMKRMNQEQQILIDALLSNERTSLNLSNSASDIRSSQGTRSNENQSTILSSMNLDQIQSLNCTFGESDPSIIPRAEIYISSFRTNRIIKAYQLAGMILLYNFTYFIEKMTLMRVTQNDAEVIYQNLLQRCKKEGLWNITKIRGIGSVYSNGLIRQFNDKEKYREKEHHLSMLVGKYLLIKKDPDEMLKFLDNCCNRNSSGTCIINSLSILTESL
uniref:RING-type domain-containing protein n=1 Tax=Acrobeloides nanus TaxID=290746 RepID=A0A914E4T3_9BILA